MRKFEMPEQKTKVKSTNKSIMFPTDLVDEIKKATAGKNCTFSAFVVASTRYALENLEKDEQWYTDSKVWNRLSPQS